jgi:hypothetical protein
MYNFRAVLPLTLREQLVVGNSTRYTYNLTNEISKYKSLSRGMVGRAASFLCSTCNSERRNNLLFCMRVLCVECICREYNAIRWCFHLEQLSRMVKNADTPAFEVKLKSKLIVGLVAMCSCGEKS